MTTHVLFLGLVANALAHASLLIMLPALGREIGWSDLQTGALLSLSAFALMLVAPLWGRVCERWGRRPVLLIGLLAAALFPLGFALLVDLWRGGAVSALGLFGAVLALRLVQALMSGGVMPAAQAVLADLTSAERRAGGMGLMGAAFGLGTILGGALAWRIGGRDAVSAFLLVGAVAGVAWLLLAWRLAETAPGRPNARGQDVAPLPWRRLWPHLLVTLLGLSVYSLLQQVTALRLQDLHGLTAGESIARAGLLMMSTMAAMVLVQGLLVRRLQWSPTWLLRGGALLALGALTLTALAPDPRWLALGMALLGAGFGLLLPGNLAGLSLGAGPLAQARVAGINVMVQGLGMTLGPVSGAALHQLDPLAPYWTSVVLMTLVSLVALRVRAPGGVAMAPHAVVGEGAR
ncbi:MFS transporter [Marichromatium purpuratum 984]|uniref:MFS transporter n=1 Tax=Marichromatium purpuratum 984 TaxID=765910 RepID=W0E1J9_MARPU|nr:MFS transporter [Marichromatium purpuratum]AHF04597.1 MFS transporter [Marichromatium purpuratum 984]